METQKKQLESRAQILFVNKDMINFEEVTRQRSLGWSSKSWEGDQEIYVDGVPWWPSGQDSELSRQWPQFNPLQGTEIPQPHGMPPLPLPNNSNTDEETEAQRINDLPECPRMDSKEILSGNQWEIRVILVGLFYKDPFWHQIISNDKNVLLFLVQGGKLSHGKCYKVCLGRKGFQRALLAPAVSQMPLAQND